MTPEVLRTAAALIGTHGWIQHDYGNEAEGYCASGACYTAADLLDIERFSATRDLDRFLTDKTDIYSIPDWNDDPKRTKAQVIRTLLEAADAYS